MFSRSLPLFALRAGACRPLRDWRRHVGCLRSQTGGCGADPAGGDTSSDPRIGPKGRSAQSGQMLWLAESADWPFADACLSALGKRPNGQQDGFSALKIWRRLPQWEDAAPPGAQVMPIKTKLMQRFNPEILKAPPPGENRPEQDIYARGVAPAFAPAPDVMIPASFWQRQARAWARPWAIWPRHAWQQKNKGPIWLSTYTRNLQRQLDREFNKLYPNPAYKGRAGCRSQRPGKLPVPDEYGGDCERFYISHGKFGFASLALILLLRLRTASRPCLPSVRIR